MRRIVLKEKVAEDILYVSPHYVVAKGFLQSLGVSENLNGYRYILTAVLYALDNPEVDFMSTRKICYILAEIYHSTPISIESSISRTIDKVWSNCSNIVSTSNCQFETKPNICQFMKLIRDYTINHSNISILV